MKVTAYGLHAPTCARWGSPEHLRPSSALDDAYRIVLTAPPRCAIARSPRVHAPILEKLITSLTTAVDSSYSEGVTGAKLALIRALSVLGA